MKLAGLRDKALRAALPLLSSSMAGRMLIRKALQLAAEKTGLPISGEYEEERETWKIVVGEESAPMQVTLHATTDALSSAVETLLPDILAGRKIPQETILTLLRGNMCAPSTSAAGGDDVE